MAIIFKFVEVSFNEDFSRYFDRMKAGNLDFKATAHLKKCSSGL